MKKIFTLGFAALLVAGLAGCVNEGFKKADNGTVLTLTGTQGDVVDENGTRVYHEGNKTYWNEGDAIGVFIDGQGVNNAELTGTTSDNITATFSGALGTTLDEGTYTVYAYYPRVNIGEPSTEPYSERARVFIPTTQTPEVNTFDAKSAVLYANPIEITLSGTHTSDFQAIFNYATTIANFVLADIAASVDNEPITSFKVTMPDNIAGRREINLKTGEFGNWYSSDEYTSTSITATFDVEDNFVANGTNGIFIGMAPITVAEGATVLVEAQTASYNISKTIAVPRDKVFAKGTINTIRISNLDVTAKAAGAPLPFEEDFAGIVGGNSTASGGSGTSITDISAVTNGNFESGTTMYAAGGAIRLGSGSAYGSIVSKALDLSEDIFTIVVSWKPWSENTPSGGGALKVTTSGGQTETLSLNSTTWPGAFTTQYIYFNAEPGAMSTITFESVDAGTSSDQRIFIDDINIVTGLVEPEPYFTATPDKALTNVAAAGTTGTITISSNTTWLADCENWITLDIDNGDGNAEITYTILENESETPRGALDAIHFMADGVDEFIDIEVQQAGKLPDVGGDTWVLDGASISSTASKAYNAAPWSITATDGSIWNMTGVMKSGAYLQIRDDEPGTIVSPTCSGPVLTVVVNAYGSGSGATLTVYDETGTTEILTQNIGTTPAADYVITLPSSYEGTGVVLKTKSTRTIYIYGITINADAGDPNAPRLKAENDTALSNVAPEGVSGTITVTSNVAWSVDKPDWVTLSTASGSNDGTFNYTILENETTTPRTGNIVVTGTGVATPVSFAISQRGQGGALTESPYFKLEATAAFGGTGYRSSSFSAANTIPGATLGTANFDWTYGQQSSTAAGNLWLGANSSNWGNLSLGSYTDIMPLLPAGTQKAAAAVNTTSFESISKIEIVSGTFDGAIKLALFYKTATGNWTLVEDNKSGANTTITFTLGTPVTGQFALVVYSPNTSQTNCRLNTKSITYYTKQ